MGVGLMPSIEIPEVIHHDSPRTLAQMTEICQAYVEQEKKPCTTVTIDGKVCYAYMELDGNSQPVQCYVRLEEQQKE
jgi:hypothetical protein